MKVVIVDHPKKSWAFFLRMYYHIPKSKERASLKKGSWTFSFLYFYSYISYVMSEKKNCAVFLFVNIVIKST